MFLLSWYIHVCDRIVLPAVDYVVLSLRENRGNATLVNDGGKVSTQNNNVIKIIYRSIKKISLVFIGNMLSKPATELQIKPRR